MRPLALVQPGVLAVAHRVARLHFLASHVLVEITDVQLLELLQAQHACGKTSEAGHKHTAACCQGCFLGTQHPQAGGRTGPRGQPRAAPQVLLIITKSSTITTSSTGLISSILLTSPCPCFPLLHVVLDDAVPHPGCDLLSCWHAPAQQWREAALWKRGPAKSPLTGPSICTCPQWWKSH